MSADARRSGGSESRSEGPALPSVATLRAGFAEPDPADRPMMRWWWFGPDQEHAEIDRELAAMAAAGLGGAEVAVVYPLRETTDRYGSERMLAALRHAAEQARSLGLRLDVTLGSGWSFGGPHIGPEHASRRLRWERREISPAPLEVGLRPAWPGDEFVGAYLGEGASPTTWEHLPVASGSGADVALRIPPGRGPRTVLLAWSEVTGQQVKRSAAGAEGPVLDHLSASATRHHLDVVGEALLGAVPAELLGSVFCDSLEVYEAGWTPSLPEEFARRRGYDPIPVLHRLVTEEPDPAPTTPSDAVPPDRGRLRVDMGRTLGELVEENFLAVCRDWAAAHGVPFRVQAYGEPPVTLSAYRSVDLVEGEGAGWTSITACRWASSAAHLLGRDVVSSEIWTWVHSPSFRATPLDLQAEAHDHLLSGITRFVGHGWPYSPPDAPGLGWRFYAAGALDDRNPWWSAMPELTASLARLCGLLRQGEPVADVAVLLPADDARAAHPGGFDLFKASRDRIGPRIPAAIRTGGRDLDLVDDPALEDLAPDAYPVVVVAGTSRAPASTRAWLDAVRVAGGTVLAVDSPLCPKDEHVSEDAVAAALDAALPPDVSLTGDGGQIGVVHRRLADADLYLIANTGAAVRSIAIAPRTQRESYEIWDPADGSVRAPATAGAGAGNRAVALELHPYQAIVLVGTDERATGAGGPEGPGPAAGEGTDAGTSQRPEVLVQTPLAGPWAFTSGADAVREVMLPHGWEGELPPERTRGTYEQEVEIPAEHLGPGLRVELDLGPCTPMPRPADAQGFRAEVQTPVGEIAVVEVDGQRAGIIWRAPHRLDLTGHLRPGRNRIRLTVLTTAAGPSAVDPHVEPMVAESRRLYGERFELQDLDRALEGVRRGLHEVPVLRVRQAA
ncbi:hypothetical protein DEO23_04525 [Brachybacterium endophyticum]|uniref:Glycoside hydrolase n=1 Tax=Brachybacterium endophyticum TaxID=2182385 RepID=A0A2U2RK88_9MICO|nr:glycosyl hydrolase [Brachybacterium endophyticum]PWH06256.1 hypothetical protein DEO23_04525 [Brachybacterium endophyticum]